MFKWILAIVIGLCSLSMAGCQEQLFSQQADMTPYARYQQLHGNQVSSDNSRWGITPAQLRQRLEPMNSQ